MRAFALAAAALIAAGLMLTGCGGSGTTTLHGTFTDVELMGGMALPATCQTWENADNLSGNYSSWQVLVQVDNISAGAATIHWKGKPQPNISRIQATCTGTWSITVPTARVGYSLSLTGVSGSTTVPTSDGGNPVNLSSIGPLIP